MARGVLGQVVDYDQGVLPAIAKILGHSECREWCDPLQARRTRRTGHDDDTSLGSSERGDCVDDTTDAGSLLANCDINAEHVARLLIDDRVDRDRSLAGGAVADNEFALTAAKCEQGIDYDKAGLNGLCHEITIDDGGCRSLDRFPHICGNWPLAVERAAERIDDAAEERWPDWHAHDIAGAAHSVAGLDRIHIVECDATDPAALKHLGEAELTLVETYQLVELNGGKTGDKCNAVPDFFHPADLFTVRPKRRGADLCAGAIEPIVRQDIRIVCHSRGPQGFW